MPESTLSYHWNNKTWTLFCGTETSRTLALDFYDKKINEKLTAYDEVYIGHTPIPFKKPVNAGDVWLMDTGAGWTGVLSMMDINTKEVFTSDPVPIFIQV